MRNYKKITVIFIFFLAVIFLLPKIAFAQGIWGIDQLDGINLGTQSLGNIITGIINVALGFLGIISLSIMLYGGYLWMTSGGNAERVEKAKKTLINGFIGLMIITSAYAIVRFLFGEAMNTIFNNGGSGGSSYNAPSDGMAADVLDSHYPARNANGIPRNTNIFVTFTEDMDFNTIANLGSPSCVINGDIVTCPARNGYVMLEEIDGPAVDSGDLLVTFDNANPVGFSINPFGDTSTHLGNDSNPVTYKAILDGVRTNNDQGAFGEGSSNVYWWQFTVSTEVDVTPPEVTSVYPASSPPNYPLNSVVQINFSEAVNPITAGGIYAPPTNNFNNISLVGDAGVGQIEGAYVLANQYRTVEFLTTNDCGTNTCGEPIYCLPDIGANYTINGTVTTNIADMAGNTTTAPYLWGFDVVDEIYVEPPELVEMQSIVGVDLEDPIYVRFNEQLMANSVNGGTVILKEVDPINPTIKTRINRWVSVTNTPDFDTIEIAHDPFNPSTRYEPTLKSGIKNMTQNCWYPCECTAASGVCYCDNNDPVVGTDCAGGQGSNCGNQ